MKLTFLDIESPMGDIRVAANNSKLSGVWFVGQKYDREPYASDNTIKWVQDNHDPLLSQVAAELTSYFEGNRSGFHLPLGPGGTPFQQSVWGELVKIPIGQTITYGELAKRIGKPQAVRAAAAAVGRNPISIVIPCHRVVGSNGSLTGYAGGVDKKRKLLSLESEPVMSA